MALLRGHHGSGLQLLQHLRAAAAVACSSSSSSSGFVDGAAAAAAGPAATFWPGASAASSSSGAPATRYLHSLCVPGPLDQPSGGSAAAAPLHASSSGNGGSDDPSCSAPEWRRRRQWQEEQQRLQAEEERRRGQQGAAPEACGHPKDKISRHRASLRRRIYYKRPQGLLAFCRFCQNVGGPHEQMQGSGRCSGRCLDGQPRSSYPPEFKSPC